MKISHPCWKCEYKDCGNIWVAKDETPPDQCSKCRRRGWNKKGVAGASLPVLDPVMPILSDTGPATIKAPQTTMDAVATGGSKVTFSQPTPSRPPMPSRPALKSKSCPDCGSLSGLHQRWCKKGTS